MATKPNPIRATRAAIKAAGGPTAMARELRKRGRDVKTRQVVQQWGISGRVPPEHCPDVEAMTGIRCEELRPDVNWSLLRVPCCPEKQAA